MYVLPLRVISIFVGFMVRVRVRVRAKVVFESLIEERLFQLTPTPHNGTSSVVVVNK